MHNEMIQPSHFGIIGRTCIASVLMIVGVSHSCNEKVSFYYRIRKP